MLLVQVERLFILQQATLVRPPATALICKFLTPIIRIAYCHAQIVSIYTPMVVVIHFVSSHIIQIPLLGLIDVCQSVHLAFMYIQILVALRPAIIQ